jgi:hypothetical protein
MAEVTPFVLGELDTLVDMLNLVCARLGRLNRNLRRHIPTAGAVHSDATVLAVVAHESDDFFRPPDASRRATQA